MDEKQSGVGLDLFLGRADERDLAGFQLAKQLTTDTSLRVGLIEDSSEGNPLTRVPVLRMGLVQNYGSAFIQGEIGLPLAPPGNSLVIGGTTRRRTTILSDILTSESGGRGKSAERRFREGLPDDLYLNVGYDFSPRVRAALTLGNIDSNSQRVDDRDYLGIETEYRYEKDIEIKAGIKSSVLNEYESTDQKIWTEIDFKF